MHLQEALHATCLRIFCFASTSRTVTMRVPVTVQLACAGRNETTKTHERQLQFLVYHLEAASLMADQHGVGKMMWLVDFVGYSFMTAPPMRISIQTVHILQVGSDLKLVPVAKPSALCPSMALASTMAVSGKWMKV